MEIVNHQRGCELNGKRKMKQEEGDQQQSQEEEQGPQVVATSACQDSTKSNLLLPLPASSCSDKGQEEKTMTVADAAAALAVSDRMERKVELAAAAQGACGGRLPPRRHWWGDCLPHVVLLREALLSTAPDIAVLGPLHGCFAFYMTHLHNEVLSSAYAKTMTFGANVTRLESAFMWVGGWRPTSALVLVYSLMGIDIENALLAVRAGREVDESSTSSLLSTRQLAIMHSMQKHTQHAEMKITKKLTVLQMLIGDQDVLEAVLKDAASPVANDSSRFHQVAEKRMSRFRRLLVQAEELRLHTLKDLLSLLTPIQAARCGVAVFELCSSLHTMGSIPRPTLPDLAMEASPVVTPLLPSGLVDEPVVAGSGELGAPELSCPDSIVNSWDVLPSQSQEPIIYDVSTCDNNIRNFYDVPVSESCGPLVSDVSSSSKILHASDVLLDQSDETARLVPSCSNSSSSQLLPQDSSRSFKRDQKSRSWPAILPLVQLNLDDLTDGHVSTIDQHQRVGKGSEGRIISSRLLLLSPASSDVVIQNCNLDSSGLPSYFESHCRLLPPSDNMGVSYQVQPVSREIVDKGGSCQTPPGRMSVPCECARQGSQST